MLCYKVLSRFGHTQIIRKRKREHWGWSILGNRKWFWTKYRVLWVKKWFRSYKSHFQKKPCSLQVQILYVKTGVQISSSTGSTLIFMTQTTLFIINSYPVGQLKDNEKEITTKGVIPIRENRVILDQNSCFPSQNPGYNHIVSTCQKTVARTPQGWYRPL